MTERLVEMTTFKGTCSSEFEDIGNRSSGKVECMVEMTFPAKSEHERSKEAVRSWMVQRKSRNRKSPHRQIDKSTNRKIGTLSYWYIDDRQSVNRQSTFRDVSCSGLKREKVWSEIGDRRLKILEIRVRRYRSSEKSEIRSSGLGMEISILCCSVGQINPTAIIQWWRSFHSPIQRRRLVSEGGVWRVEAVRSSKDWKAYLIAKRKPETRNVNWEFGVRNSVVEKCASGKCETRSAKSTRVREKVRVSELGTRAWKLQRDLQMCEMRNSSKGGF